MRCVPQISSKTTLLLSTARPVQRTAKRFLAPHHVKTANAKLASSSKRTDNGNLIEKEVVHRFFFLSCLMFIGVSVTLNLGRCARNDTSEFGMPERKIMQGFDMLTIVHAALTLPA